MFTPHIPSKPSKSRVNQPPANNIAHTNNRINRDRAKTPVKVKMHSTMKRLTSEANNIPSKPNAFNLPKCPTSSTTSTQSSTGIATQTTGPKTHPQTRITAKANGSLYSVKLLSSEENSTNNSNPTHFVSSPQAKAASTVGIMSLGSAYSSVVAAANRGCLPNKIIHPYPPPQPVVPKNFPVSVVPGGDVFAGGNAVMHPGPPPGVVALSPQTIGLSLPFQKYYNMNTEPTTHHPGTECIK